MFNEFTLHFQNFQFSVRPPWIQPVRDFFIWADHGSTSHSPSSTSTPCTCCSTDCSEQQCRSPPHLWSVAFLPRRSFINVPTICSAYLRGQMTDGRVTSRGSQMESSDACSEGSILFNSGSLSAVSTSLPCPTPHHPAMHRLTLPSPAAAAVNSWVASKNLSIADELRLKAKQHAAQLVWFSARTRLSMQRKEVEAWDTINNKFKEIYKKNYAESKMICLIQKL